MESARLPEAREVENHSHGHSSPEEELLIQVCTVGKLDSALLKDLHDIESRFEFRNSRSGILIAMRNILQQHIQKEEDNNVL